MPRHAMRLLLLLLVSSAAAMATAAPPSTLGYQGRLASAGGTPVTATLSITFRLYDAPGGGTALWSETQPAVDVDGGNLGVELGTVVPLPASIWGRQLYLGVQVAGDTEMLPRPALTAAPYALRAGATMKRTIVVSAEGTPTENGAALLAAIAGITDASATSPVTVELDAGTFDLGAERAHLPEYTTLAGRGRAATLVTSSVATALGSLLTAATITLRSNTAVRDLTARNTGISAIPEFGTSGIEAYDPDVFQQVVVNVSLVRVTGESVAAAGSSGQRAGVSLCVANSEVRDVAGRAFGGEYGMGLRSDCTGEGVIIDGAELEARESTLGLRGAYLAGGGLWRNITVALETHPGLLNVYGIRLFPAGGDTVELVTPKIIIRGNDILASTQTSLIEGIRIEHGIDASISGASIALERVKGVSVSGLRASADNTTQATTRLVGADIRISAVQDAATGPGSIQGLRLQGTAPQILHSNIDVRCLAPGYNTCYGIHQQQPTGNLVQPGPLQLEHSRVLARHDDPADGSAATMGLNLAGPGIVRESTVGVVRSSDLEFHFAIRLTHAASVRVHGSTVSADTPSNPANSCSVGGDGTAELFGNVVFGQFSCGTPITYNCAGNTRAGAGFLAAGCL